VVAREDGGGALFIKWLCHGLEGVNSHPMFTLTGMRVFSWLDDAVKIVGARLCLVGFRLCLSGER